MNIGVIGTQKGYDLVYSALQKIGAHGSYHLGKTYSPHPFKNWDLLLSIGADIIPKKYFPLPIPAVNIHTAPLPQYRGCATDSWMILNGDDGKRWWACTHFLTPTIDGGNIIAVAEWFAPHRAKPIEIYNERVKTIPSLLKKTIHKLKQDFKGKPQNLPQATYFPRLDTEIDGFIDWTQTADMTERHVRAFSVPYPGAWTVFRGAKTRILEGYSDDGAPRLHSNAIGLIYGLDGKNGVKIKVGLGTYVITESEPGPPDKVFPLGRYMATPKEEWRRIGWKEGYRDANTYDLSGGL